jgi:hypothetical protein
MSQTLRNILILGGPWAGLVAGAGDLVVPLLLASRVDGYSHLGQPVSDLGAAGSPVAAWMNGWWILFGLLMLWFAAAIACVLGPQGRSGWVLAGQIACLGLFAGIGSGLFPLTPEAGEGVSTSTHLHNLFGALGFLPVLAAPAVSIWLFPPGRSAGMFALCAATQVAGLATAALYTGLAGCLLPKPWSQYTGLWQRAFLVNLYTYLAALAVSLLSSRP